MGGSVNSGVSKAVSDAIERSCLTRRHRASAKVCGGCRVVYATHGIDKWEPEQGSRDGGTSRPKTEVPTRGLRYNKGKRRFDLIPPDSLAVLADVLTVGAEKYAERNWEVGMPYKDAIGSLERHLQDWKAGEDKDQESGLSHLAHVMCNAMFLLTWQLRNLGEDDRVKVKMPDAPSRNS